MGKMLSANNVSSTLAANITAAQTTLAVAAGTGILYPAPTGGDWYFATLQNSSVPPTIEIVKVTARSGDNLTIVRGQDGTSPNAFLAGDVFEMRENAGKWGQVSQQTASTGSLMLPEGTTAQRDSSPGSGYIRFNTDISQFEGYNGTSWASVGGGATGGGPDQVFNLNGQTVTTSYSIPSGKSANSTGPITIQSGVTVTVPPGSRWVIL